MTHFTASVKTSQGRIKPDKSVRRLLTYFPKSSPPTEKKRCGNRDRIAGSEHDLCPYFSSKVPINNAEVIFCPHPYLFNTVMRKTLEIQLQDAIVINDDTEAAESAARDAISVELGDTELNQIEEEFNMAIRKKRLPEPNSVLLTVSFLFVKLYKISSLSNITLSFWVSFKLG